MTIPPLLLLRRRRQQSLLFCQWHRASALRDFFGAGSPGTVKMMRRTSGQGWRRELACWAVPATTKGREETKERLDQVLFLYKAERECPTIRKKATWRRSFNDFY